MYIKNFIGHFMTITRHRHEVIKNCARVGILCQGLRHDLSKYSPREFFQGVKYYSGTKSPNDGARVELGYSSAWMHHKGRNLHHFEYWTDYDPNTRRVTPVKMPLKYVAEMFCDRVAASKIYMKESYNDASPLNYFLGGKKVRDIHGETSELIEHFLRVLAEQGEESAFKYVKEYLRTHDDY
ncbi:MAG: DUF5662 family protein [Clostridia bacterium]|nr:DUF5662 family protein [Clostridia bacterium]